MLCIEKGVDFVYLVYAAHLERDDEEPYFVLIIDKALNFLGSGGNHNL